MTIPAQNSGFPLDQLALNPDENATALQFRTYSLSYKMLNHRVGRLAFTLLSLGLKKGDRVAAWLPKTEIACLMPLAAARAQLVYVPINPVLKEPQLLHIIRDSGARLLIGNAARVKGLQTKDLGPCRLHDDKLLQAEIESDGSSLEHNKGLDINDLVQILYTSGSTGLPKGVMLSHANLSLGAISVSEYLKMATDDRTLCVLPLSFDYGQNQLFSTWAAGGCAVPLDYLTSRDVIKACGREKITTLAAVPPLWVQIVEGEWPDSAIEHIRRLTNSGGALTPLLVQQLRHIFGRKTDIYAMYGLTEAFRSTYLDPSLIDTRPDSMGTAIPFAEVFVIDEQGNVCAPEQEGELVHAGPLVAQGYWQDPEKTARRFKPAPAASQYGGMAVWSGDTVKRDSGGLLYFVGRDDAMIKSSGNRISPAEIEQAAIAQGQVVEALAIGVPDDRLGQKIRLFVRFALDVSDTQNAKEKLAGDLKKYLPNFMQPHDIIVLKEFPKNPNGKLDRNALSLMT